MPSGYRGCRFCYGNGCLACEQERRRDTDAEIRALQDEAKREQLFGKPILTWTASFSAELAAMQDDGCPNIDLPVEFHEEDLPDNNLGRLTKLVMRLAPAGTGTWGRE